MSWTLNGLLGNAYGLMGNVAQVIKVRQHALKIATTHNFPIVKFTTLANLGVHYQDQGNLIQSLDVLHQALDIYTTLSEINLGMKKPYWIWHNIGETYRVQGEFELALDYLHKSLQGWSSQLDYDHMAETLSEIGETFRQQGDFTKAKDYLERSSIMYKQVKNDYDKPHLFFYQMRLALDQHNLSQLEIYKKQMQELQDTTVHGTTSKHLEQNLWLLNALILKNNPRMAQKMLAQQQLAKLVKEEVLRAEITALAMVNLAELLLDELRTYGEPAVLTEVENLINEFYELGQSNHAYPIIIQALILKAQLSVLQANLEAATKYLSQAELLTKEKGLKRLNSQVQLVQSQLDEQFAKAQELIRNNVSLQKRLEQSRLDTYLKEVQKTLNL